MAARRSGNRRLVPMVDDRAGDCPGPELTILYDEGCGLCRTAVGLIVLLDRRGAMRPMGFEAAVRGGLAAGLEPAELRRSWHAVDRRGRRFSGGAAVAPVLDALPGGRLPARLARLAPGAVDRIYRAVAARRSSLGRLVPAAVRDRAEHALRRRAGGGDAQREG